MGVDSCAPVGPTAASGPGFHVRWPPPGPRVCARSIPVSAGWRGPPADARLPLLSINYYNEEDVQPEARRRLVGGEDADEQGMEVLSIKT